MSKAPLHLFRVPNIEALHYQENGDSEDNPENRRNDPPDRNADGHVEQSRPNARPPVQHTFINKDSKTNGSFSRPSTAASGGRSRPVSARSLFSLDYSIQENQQAATTTVDDMITVVKGVKQGNLNKDFEKELKIRQKKKLIIIIIVVVLTLFLIATALGSVLPTVLSEKSSKKEKNQDVTIATATTTPTTTSPEDTGSTRIPPSTPSPHPVLVIDDNNDNITYGGTWLEWSAWSECSRSCNAGTQSRNRICGSEEFLCLGASIQLMRCNTALCPISEPEALWSTWNSWEECSVSCESGTQIRRRLCVELETSRSVAYENCVGTDELTRPCNLFPCPDCSTSCETGTLDETCTYCYCAQSITGQILSDSGLPLDNVTITPANAPFTILATSITGGTFVISNACVDQSFSFHKHGYITFTGNLTNAFENLTLTQRVPLQVLQNPRNKMAVTGGSVTFCCGLYGNPQPDYYEWLKNGDVLPNNHYSTSSALELENVTPDDTGFYQCRASNEYGAIFSAIATLMVEDDYSAYCSPIPSSHVISLPDGCTINNETSIDKGQCEGNLCYSGSNNGCDSETRYYCKPSGLQIANAECDDYTLPILLITSCACQIWQEDALTIYGFAGSRDGQPLQYGNIYWNGSLISNTSADGTLSFRITRGTSRSSLLFIDVYNRTFMDTTYIFYFPSDSESSLFIRVNIMLVGLTYSINASQPLSIPMNGTTIDIPAGSFYTQDGQLYTGTVTAYVCTVDPSNIDDLTSAPGDLTIIDEEGESQQLLSYGMFAMSFEDDTGNQLSIPGEITISVPMSEIHQENTSSEIRVWALNPSTGVWEQAGDLVSEEESPRTKRQIDRSTRGQQTFMAILRGISIQTKWYNFDFISTQTCVVKVRLFETDAFNSIQQIHNGQVFVVTEDSNGYNSLSTNRVSTDTGNNGYCMVLPCSSHRSSGNGEFRGYIFADSRTTEMIPERQASSGGLSSSNLELSVLLHYAIDRSKINVDFNEYLVHEEGDGPFYDYERKWKYSSRCSNATFISNHFRFASVEVTGCYYADDAQRGTPEDQNAEFIGHLLLWFDITSYFPPLFGVSPFSRLSWAYKTCFIKVKAPSGLLIQSESYVSDQRHEFYGQRYGIRKDCVVDEAICVEVRPPQRPRIAPYVNTSAVDDERQTKIVVSVIDSSPLELHVNNELATTYIENIAISASLNTFEIFLIDEPRYVSYGSRYGIFCEAGEERDEVIDRAKSKCRDGTDNPTFLPRTLSNNWAVEFRYPATTTSTTTTHAPTEFIQDIRLSHGSYGILQIMYNNQWGTVCDDGFSNIGCQIVCRQLQYQYGVFIYMVCGEGTGPIWLDDVLCSGIESRLDHCLHGQPIGSHNCGHHEDVWCRCCNNNPYCDNLRC